MADPSVYGSEGIGQTADNVPVIGSCATAFGDRDGGIRLGEAALAYLERLSRRRPDHQTLGLV